MKLPINEAVFSQKNCDCVVTYFIGHTLQLTAIFIAAKKITFQPKIKTKLQFFWAGKPPCYPGKRDHWPTKATFLWPKLSFHWPMLSQSWFLRSLGFLLENLTNTFASGMAYLCQTSNIFTAFLIQTTLFVFPRWKDNETDARCGTRLPRDGSTWKVPRSQQKHEKGTRKK